MGYTGRVPSAAPLSQADIDDGVITPDELSTGAPSWDTSGNISIDGTLNLKGSNSTGVETTLIKYSDTSDDLGSIRTYNAGSYNQDLRFYSSNLAGSGNEELAVTIRGSDGFILPNKGLAPTYESNWESAGAGHNHFFAHGLGRVPNMVRLYWKIDGAVNNKPILLVGDLGAWGQSGNDYGVTAAVSNTYIVVAQGESGISTDWGISQSGFPYNDNALESYYSTYGQNNGADLIDTPTETAGALTTGYFKVLAW